VGLGRGQGKLNIADAFQRHWRPLVLLFWLGTAAYLIWDRWANVQGFALSDTDDNLRMMQVRAWLLEGQGWYDLRQYRMNLPDGLNVHWSRIVDLPIAGVWSLFGLFMDGPAAERWAVAIAPLLPLVITMGALALVARRLLSPFAFWLALALILFAGSAMAQFVPTRIDHHGWQLTALAVGLAGIADPRLARGGVTLGIASGFSLAIGLEMLLYLLAAGVATVLSWVRDPAEGRRLAGYGISFAGASTVGYLVFGSYDNALPMCDALSPVWLSVVLAAGAIALALSWLKMPSMWLRLAAAVAGGALLAGFYVLFWPDCVGRLERVPAELDQLWLRNVREAMPVWRHGLGTTIGITTLPVIGLIGYATMLWRTRREPTLFERWAAMGYIAAFALLLLLWQTRAAGAAQLLAVPGAAALGWVLILWFQRQRSMLVRVLGIAASFVLASGAIVTEAWGWWDEDKPPSEYEQRINNANWRCPQPGFLHPIAQQPKGLVLTFVDMGPRLITLTHHDALTGPYHRNAQAILDVMRAFRGDEANAREIINRRGIDYVLLCPDMSESTIYRAEAPEGWYVKLMNGQVPGWLEPISLPANSPFRMWRVRR
jgi:hypothetical protein